MGLNIKIHCHISAIKLKNRLYRIEHSLPLILQMQRIPLIYLPLIGALLFALSWPYIGFFSGLIFITWVPMLLAEDHIFRKKYRPRKVFFLAYLFFVLVNLFTTWWIWLASAGGAIMAIFANALLMTIPFWLFHVTKRRIGVKEGYIALIINWLGFEFLHYRWELSWPWLSLGNVFANDVKIIQWYDVSGVSGGTLWILIINLLLFFIIRDAFWLKTKTLFQQKFRLTFACLILVIPISSSVYTYFNYQEKSHPIDVVIVQPNIDPYHTKFNSSTYSDQLDVFFSLAKTQVDDHVDFLLGPETQLSYPIEENHLEQSSAIKRFRDFLKDFPKLRIISGLSGYEIYESENEKSSSAHPLEDGMYYDHYNSAFQIGHNTEIDLYHKMKLVLGVEKIPFSSWLPFLENFALEMGGTSGSMGTEIAPKNFVSGSEAIIPVAPAICYESIYGDHIAEFVEAGACLLTVITNDGWWEDTPGYKQHLTFSRIRAIENRRSVARCANTGISCFINQRGDIIKQTGWWKEEVIREKLNANFELTYYTKNKDFIGRTSVFVAIFLLIYTLSRWLMGKTTIRKEI